MQTIHLWIQAYADKGVARQLVDKLADFARDENLKFMQRVLISFLYSKKVLNTTM